MGFSKSTSLQAIMEEITGFEERLESLKDRGEDLVASCVEHLQSKVQQQVQAHQQGTRDSYAAICSTSQRVRVTLSVWAMQSFSQ